MQYGHCVVKATATAISSLYLTGIAPAATDALSNATNAFIVSGAWASRFFILLRFFMSYIAHLLSLIFTTITPLRSRASVTFLPRQARVRRTKSGQWYRLV